MAQLTLHDVLTFASKVDQNGMCSQDPIPHYIYQLYSDKKLDVTLQVLLALLACAPPLDVDLRSFCLY